MANLPTPLTPEKYQKALDYAKLASKAYDRDDWLTAEGLMRTFFRGDGIDEILQVDFETPQYVVRDHIGTPVDLMFEGHRGFDYTLYEHLDSKNVVDTMVIAFRGTEPLSVTDWIQNYRQVLGGSEQYRAAIDLAKQEQELLKERNARDGTDIHLEFTGHSLGGGLATAAALATGNEAIVFDAAGISDYTMNDRELGLDRNKQEKVTNINVEGCFVADYNGKKDRLTLGTDLWLQVSDDLIKSLGLLTNLVFWPVSLPVHGGLLFLHALEKTDCKQYGPQIWLKDIDDRAVFLPKHVAGVFVPGWSAQEVEDRIETYLSHAWHLYTYQLEHRNFVV